MNKAELITSMAEKSQLTKKDAESALKAFIDSVQEALENGDKVQLIASALNMPEDMPLEMKMLTNTIETAQKNVEAIHFANRKRVLQ